MIEFEFHVSRSARQKYQFEESLFALDGRVLLADFAAARRFAEQMTRLRGQAVPASDINAMGLIDEILHILIRQYEMQNPGVMARALDRLTGDVKSAMLKFTTDFPPQPVLHGKSTAGEYLNGSTAGRPHRQSTVEEMLVLFITNRNPAVQPYQELFDDSELRAFTAYPLMIASLEQFFRAEPGLGSGKESLFDLLTAPARVAPHSLSAQLEFLLNRWGAVLGDSFVRKILRSLDFLKEEVIRGSFAGGFAGNAPMLTFGGHDYTEYERFSPDKDWMPQLVLLAKNSYVWLDQLSKQYQRPITHLDQIPDEELDMFNRRGITGLWLIGLWERSTASQRIKQRLGQSDAVASAYSLMDYQIAADLGGWEALQNLRWRAWQRGVRLAADMVPNHMGIDSTWVVEHPDWFLSLPYSPYPNYSFNSGDLSSDGRAAIFLEDHYYDKTDAAVVFQRVDRSSGETRYIYHGNDGTSMPWNDTAQLDFSKAQVREAVIQTILHVARNFPVIRFDAAMTLAKKHIQRLWFPEPGAGGAIPSRSEHGMTRAEFDAAIPQEFWREVVDRVAAEVPDTLLLAEAFWLMEGYFVRTLGMHRVYNSAFMHMLRDEDNAKYRTVMKNVLEFDPQVIKRFVNFMNNPDEKTAAEQFGTTDKYFGVCTLLVTLPGLPMFGHGQIEGYREKYGMEFRRPKWDEPVDEGLVNGHNWRIFPLTHRRHIFAEAENFRLYDFFTTDGTVNEDVFAYSNRRGADRGLVVYQNKYAETRGWVRTSAAYMDKSAGRLVQSSLSAGLDLPSDGYAIFRDYVTGLEYIRPCRELAEKGLFVELGPYKCHVFLDWRFVDGETWRQVHESVHGEGQPSLQARFEQIANPPPATPAKAPRKKAAGRTPGKGKAKPKSAPRKPAAKPAANRESGTKAKPKK
jgi:hypothetical protein